jgi:hypothetical protein
MRAVGRLLSALGRHGPILLVISLGLGVASPHMARAGYGLLPLSAFLLTLGSFLTAGLAPSEAKIRMEVADAAGQAVDARHDQHIALAQEIENRPELGAAFSGGAACLLLPDRVAAGGVESFKSE